MDAFIKQYQYNSNMATDRMQLQNMCKGDNESFKEYGQMIMDTLLGFYYEKMIGYMPSSFVDLVFPSERIEVGQRRGKFDYVASVSSDVVK